MNLSLAEVAELPLDAALIQGDDVVACTPEWRGGGPGTITYRVRGGRLVVGVAPAPPRCVLMLDLLLDELSRLAAALGGAQGRRVAMVAASLGLLAGRVSDHLGSADEVIEHAEAGISARTGLQVTSRCAAGASVLAPSVAALVLVQLAANAEGHDGAAAVHLDADGGIFTLSWRSPRVSVGSSSPAVTSRRRADRARWGMGFARIAADALGAALYPPVRDDDGITRAVLETGITRLALPLCALREGRVLKATRAWDEETALAPPARVSDGTPAGDCLAAAEAAGGAIVTVAGWQARRGRSVTWIAIGPDGVADRARDVLDGMVHERALWQKIPLGPRVRIVALAALLAAQLGTPLPRVPAGAWNAAAPGVAAALKLTQSPPPITGLGAVDPQVALFLAAELGGSLVADEQRLTLVVPPAARDHPLAQPLARDGVIAL